MRFARGAVSMAFGLNGVVHGTWAPRVPALADQVGAQVGTMGLALLGGSVGMIIAASVTGRLTAVVGARSTVAFSGIAMCAALPVLGLASTPLLLGCALGVLGAAVGALDVSMNVAATTVVRALDRPVMPVFHAWFSFGGLFGSGMAALAATANLAPLGHFLLVGLAGVVFTLSMVRAVPDEPAAVPGVPGTPPAMVSARAPARRPVLWLIAVIALCSAIAEGASAEWSALFLVRERGVTEGAAAAAYSAFSVAMALARLSGERMQRRWGQERLLIGCSVLAGAGFALVVLVPSPAAGFLGFTLAGFGLAYSFPVAFTMAGVAGQRADGGGGEREIGFVTTIAYGGVLGGPPMLGGLAHVTSLSVAMAVTGGIAATIGLATLATRAARRAETPAITPADAGSPGSR